jgi:glyoxylase-like metal-dependent hydrolase (beta-lactamase superfamily II)
MGETIQLAPDLFVYRGAIQTGILRAGRRALLIDCGDDGVQEALAALGIERVERVLFTHHHRDQAGGVAPFIQAGAHIGVPAAERPWFAGVETYWSDPAQRWHLYDFHPHNLMLARSVPVHETYQEGDAFRWGTAEIAVLETPGHTDGSVSYQIDVPGVSGGERYLFCGDLLYGEGQIWDLYSLQKGGLTRDYHGFLGDRTRLVESARKLRAAHPKALIPSHGGVITNPRRAVDLLCERLDACYERYAAVSALRYYYPELFASFRTRSSSGAAWREGFMPVREGRPYPTFLRHVGTSWIVISDEGSAFVVDCGSPQVIRSIQRWQADGTLGTVDWLWISHYHDDHVDAIPQFQEAFACPVVADEHVAQIVEQPLSWRLPCISPVQIHVDRRTVDGESWTWREFRVTAYHLPGQSLYHGGLEIEGHGHRVLFAGDSFTMAGMDDYCAGNRNFLGRGVGFDACLALVERRQPDVILNCHVDQAFDFSAGECHFMRANLVERERLYGCLFPWDHPNYGMDEHWVRCHPYEQRAAPGECVRLAVVFTNHSADEREAVCRPMLPEGWGAPVAFKSVVVPATTERAIEFSFAIPQRVRPGRCVVPVEVSYDGRELGPFREAILTIEGGEQA